MPSTAFQWYRLTFPSSVKPEQFSAFLTAVHGLSRPGRGEPVVFQAVGRRRRVEHYLRLPAERAPGFQAQAVSALPGLILLPVPTVDVGQPQAAWRVWLSSSRRPLRREAPALVSQALLTAIASAGPDEVVVLQWLLGPVRRPVVVPTRHTPLLPESWPQALAGAALAGPRPIDSESRQALRQKQSEPGWRAVGRIAVQAGSRRRGLALLGQVTGALRTADAPGAVLGVVPLRPLVVTTVRLPWRWGLALSVSEVVALAAWPLGDLPLPPVDRRRSRLLPRCRAAAGCWPSSRRASGRLP
jgi:hypothetical protein